MKIITVSRMTRLFYINVHIIMYGDADKMPWKINKKPSLYKRKLSNLIALSTKIECCTAITLNKQSLHLHTHPWQQAFDFLLTQTCLLKLQISN